MPYTTFLIDFLEHPQNNVSNSGHKILNLSPNYTTDADGYIKIKNLQILSSGYFLFNVTDVDKKVSYTIATNEVKNYIKSYEPSYDKKVFIGVPLLVNYTCIGDDGLNYILPVNLSLTASPSDVVDITPKHSTDLEGRFNLTFRKAGNFTLKLNNTGLDAQGEVNITSKKNTLVLSPALKSITFLNNSDTYTIDGKVYIGSSDSIESNMGEYKFNLIAKASESLSFSSTTSKGLSSLKLQITAPGTYDLYLDADQNLDSNFSQKITFVETLKEISINSSLTQNLNSFRLIEIPLVLYGHSGAVYKNQTTVTLSCGASAVLLNTSITTKTGKASFFMYFQSIENVACTFSASDYPVLSTVTFAVSSPQGTPDNRCFIEYNSSTCFQCVNNSRLNETGFCACTQNSVYNNVSDICECDSDFVSKNNFCIQCGYYFKPSEVSSYFASDFKRIVVEFISPANINKLGASSSKAAWLSAFQIPLEYQEVFSRGEWTSNRNLSLWFDSIIDPTEFAMQMSPTLVQRVAQGACSEEVVALAATVRVKYSKPVPPVNIFAPSVISTACSSSLVSIFTTVYNERYSYKWSSDVSEIDAAIKNVSDVSIQLSYNLIQEDFQISLKISDTVFGTSNSAAVQVALIGSKTLTVAFPLGASLAYKVSQNFPIKAEVTDACGETDFEYTWSISDGLATNSTLLESLTTSIPNLIFLKKGLLEAGITYTLTVLVNSSNGITGTSSIKIITESTPLVLTLNKASGSASKNFNLSLSVSAVDPDDKEFSDFSYSWTCIEGASSCKDADGQALLGSEPASQLFVLSDKLKSGSYYNFVVKVSRSSPSKSQTSQVLLYFSDKIKGQIVMPSITGSWIRSRFLLLKPRWVVEGEPEIKWAITPSLPSSAGVALDIGYLYIPANTLEEGQSYTLDLALKVKGAQDSTAVTASVSLYVNAPPTCSGFSAAREESGKIVFDAQKCFDSDSSSLIFYQFGVYDEESGLYKWLTKPLFSSSYKLRLKDDQTEAAYRVCDLDFSCSFNHTEVSNNSTGRLLSIEADFNNDIEDPDEIPSAVIYFSSRVSNESDYLVLFNKLSEYFNSGEIDEATFDNFVSSFLTLVQNTLAATSLSEDSKYQALEFMNEIVLAFGSKITDANFDVIISVFELLSSALESRTVSEYLDLYGKYSLLGSAFGEVLSEASNYSRSRADGATLANSSLSSLSKISVRFPEDLSELDSAGGSALLSSTGAVFDISITSYVKENQVFEVTFKRTGANSDGLEIYDLAGQTETEIRSESGIEVSLKGSFDSEKTYECVYLDSNDSWVSGGCEVTSNDGENMTLTTKHLSIFSVLLSDASDGECGTGAGPIATMSVIIFLVLFCGLMLKLSDREVKAFGSINKFLALYPLSSLFFRQPMMRRAVILIQILTSELLMLALIGAFHNHWDETNDESDNSFSNYYGRQLRRGAAGWALTQAFTIPIFVLNAFMLTYKKYHYVTLPACAFFIVGSFVGIIVMTVYYCKPWTEYWIANWLIFLLFDIATLEIIYALILSYLVKGVEVEGAQPVEVKKSKEEAVSGGVTSRPPGTVRDPENNYSYSSSSSYDIIYDPNQRSPE